MDQNDKIRALRDLERAMRDQKEVAQMVMCSKLISGKFIGTPHALVRESFATASLFNEEVRKMESELDTTRRRLGLDE